MKFMTRYQVNKIYLKRALTSIKEIRMSNYIKKMAEGEGFEPPEPFPVQRFSRPPHSTTLPSFQSLCNYLLITT